MLKFQIACSDEERVRSDFETMMHRDTPCGKGIWGNHLWRRGIHFKECGKRIKGFYMTESDNEGTRGSPLRVSFSGRFVQKGDRSFFEVYIYPSPIEFFFILLAYISISIAAPLVASVLVSLVFVVFVVGYMKGIKDAAEFFRRWVK